MFHFKNAPQAPRFSNQALLQLLIPLIIEQALMIMIGMADTVMVSNVGAEAVSGVSLVDSLNILINNILTALATGGAVIAAQYLGRGDAENIHRAAQHLVVLCAVVTLAIAIPALLLCRPLLALIFGQVEAAVMRNAQTYFILSALSYPFIGLFHAGASLFRAMGNSKVSMRTSMAMNLVNVVLNALFIFACGWGVFGAALATLISRVLGALYVLVLLLDTRRAVHIRGILHFRLQGSMMRSILRIGVPNGFEGAVFQLGKVLMLSVVAGFGTASIAANTISNNLADLTLIAPNAVGLAMITVVGQCVGAGDKEQARFYTKKLMAFSFGFFIVCGAVMLLLLDPLIGLYNQSAEAAAYAHKIFVVYYIFGIFFWPPSFTLPNALRAAGDARYAMTVSILCMWICRISLSYVFGIRMQMGVFGVWLAMYIDWIFRTLGYGIRVAGKRWLEIKSI